MSTKPLEHLRPKTPTVFDTDILLAARFLYYCHSISIMSDYDFDMAEKEHEVLHGELPGVGSDVADHYPPHVRALGLYMAMSGRAAKMDAQKGMELL